MGAEAREAPQMSAFLSDQNPVSLTSPFGGWTPALERRALDGTAGAGVHLLVLSHSMIWAFLGVRASSPLLWTARTCTLSSVVM